MSKLCALLIVCISLSFPLFAEGESPDKKSYNHRIPISGTVTDAQTKEPLAGVSVVVKNSTIGTTTSATGSFTLEVTPGSTLIISSSGYGSQEIDIKDQANITIQLSKSAGNLDEVVVVGYGTQRRKEL